MSDRLPPLASRRILGVRVDATSYADAAARVLAWARRGESRTVCVTGAHGVVEAQDDPAFADVLNGADLVTPDGMPLVWGLRRLGVSDASRVYGPTLMLHVCCAAAAAGVPIGLYGGTDARLAELEARLTEQFPGLGIAYRFAPPFRPLTDGEDAAVVRDIAASGARILFVGLGCPKQERWMAAHRGRIPAVLLGVGAAFDFHAGHVRQAPPRLQRLGLEWAFRLAMEPKRLWRRYARIVPRFLVGFGGQLVRGEGREPAEPVAA